MELIAFFLMSILVIGSGLGVVLMKNPLNGALALVLNLLTVAGLYALLGAHFLFAVQIVVYAGAIMVLVIFVIMLLNVKSEGKKSRNIFGLVLSVLAGIGFVATLAPIFLKVFSQVSGSKDVIEGSVANIGEILFTRFVFPFEVSSVLLMTAIIGAVMLAKRDKTTQRSK